MNAIKCIFFSEFHPTAGPKITYQVPEDFMSKEVFDSVHIYIITKPELQNRLITVNAWNLKIVGCPMCIDDPKYKRNALMFNLCFVFDKDSRTCNFGSVVKKLAAYFTQLELESGFLFYEEKRQQIPKIITSILTDLNKYGNCAIPIRESCTIYLKVAPCISDPPLVQDYDVPILIRDRESVMGFPLDLTTQQIMHYVDGYSHVARIAAEADVEINLVKACLQNLIHYTVIKLISIFQYSNVYTVTPEINSLFENTALQMECVQFVARKGHSLPAFRDVFMLYCSFSPGTTVKDICNRIGPHALKVDERKLVQFGLMNGLIRHLHKYPVKLPNEPGQSSRLQPFYQYFNGVHNSDEICCRHGISQQELDERMESDPSVVVCWK